MVDAVLIVGGCLVVLAVFVDALATTLSVGAGAGPVTRPLLDAIWRRLLRLPEALRPKVLPRAGPGLVVVAEVLWVGGLWFGWSLIFLGSGAITSSPGNRPASTLEVVYYTGFSIVTLGTGDYVAEAAPWRLLSVVASLSGLFLITLTITYLLSVVNTVVERRSIATTITGLGETATRAVIGGWDGERFSEPFLLHLAQLGTVVSTHAEKHLAYPVVQYFHASSRELSAPSALAQLDDVLSLLHHGMDPAHRPTLSALSPIRSGIDRHVATISLDAVTSPEEPPEPPLQPLREAGLPVVDDAAFRTVMEEEAQRRRDLHALVRYDDWSWPAAK